MNTEKLVLLNSNSWLKWTLVTATGLFMSDFVFIVLRQTPSPNFFLLYKFVTGLILGTLQWFFVLRPHIKESQQWIWVSIAGWVIGWISANLFDTSLLFLSIFVHGTILGFFQWFFFMRNMNPRSFSWVFVNGFGLHIINYLGWYSIMPMLYRVGYHGVLSQSINSIICGVLFGAITGVSFQWLLSRSKMSNETMPPDNQQTLENSA